MGAGTEVSVTDMCGANALIGSEAPGRIAWAIKRGADAHLLKPVSGGGIYSAVLIARDAFDRRQVQFHRGEPPAAAEPSTRIFIAVEGGARRVADPSLHVVADDANLARRVPRLQGTDDQPRLVGACQRSLR